MSSGARSWKKPTRSSTEAMKRCRVDPLAKPWKISQVTDLTSLFTSSETVEVDLRAHANSSRGRVFVTADVEIMEHDPTFDVAG